MQKITQDIDLFLKDMSNLNSNYTNAVVTSKDGRLLLLNPISKCRISYAKAWHGLQQR